MTGGCKADHSAPRCPECAKGMCHRCGGPNAIPTPHTGQSMCIPCGWEWMDEMAAKFDE